MKFYERNELESILKLFKNGGIDFSQNSIDKDGIGCLLKRDPLVFFSALERCLANYYRNFFKGEKVSHKQFLFLLMLLNEESDFINIGSFSKKVFFDRTTIFRNAFILAKKGYVEVNRSRISKAKKGHATKWKEVFVTEKGRKVVKDLLDNYHKLLEDNNLSCFFESVEVIRAIGKGRYNEKKG
jgi:DNA-binding MarR family transcriptional regulator